MVGEAFTAVWAAATNPAAFLLPTAVAFVFLHAARRDRDSQSFALHWFLGWLALTLWAFVRHGIISDPLVHDLYQRIILRDVALLAGYGFFITGALAYARGRVHLAAVGVTTLLVLLPPVLEGFLNPAGAAAKEPGDRPASEIVAFGVQAAMMLFAAATMFATVPRNRTFGMWILGGVFALRGLQHLLIYSDDWPEIDQEWDRTVTAILTVLMALSMIVASLERIRLALERSEQRFRDFFSRSPEPILLVRQGDGRILDANPQAAAATGMSREHLLERKLSDIISDESGIPKAEPLRRLSSGARNERVVTSIVGPGGRPVPACIARSILEIDDDSLLLLHIRDISEDRAQERALASRITQLTAIHRLSQSVTRTLEVSELVTNLFERVQSMVPVNFFAIDRLDPETDRLANQTTIAFVGGMMSQLQNAPPAAGLKPEEFAKVLLEREAAFIAADRLADASGPVSASRQLLALPMVASDHVVGIMYLGSATPSGIDPAQIDMVQNVATIAGIGLRNAQLYRDQQDQIRRQQFLAELGPQLRASLEIEDVARIAGERVRAFFRADEVEVWLFDDQEQRLKRSFPRRSDADSPAVNPASAQALDLSVAAFSTGDIQLENDVRASKLIPRKQIEERGLMSAVAVPLLAGERKVGVLRIDDTREHDRFHRADVDFLKLLAQFIGTAMEAARLFRTFRESERRFSHLVQAANVGIVILHQGRIEFANAYFQELLDLLNSPIQNVEFADLIPSDSREAWHQALEAMKKGETPTIEINLHRGEGRRLVCELSLSPVIYMRMLAVQVVVTDITDKRAAMAQRQNDLRARSIGTLTAGIGRDFQSLFSVMLAQISYLRLEGMPTETAERSLRIVEVAANRALDYTRQLLAFSENSGGGLAALDINQIILHGGQLFDSLDRRGLADLLFDLGAGLPPIRGHEEQLRQAFLNLFIGLSRQVGHGNTILVRTQQVLQESRRPGVADDLEPGDYVLVEFSDNAGRMDRDSLLDLMNMAGDTQRPAFGMSVFLSTLRGHQVVADVIRIQGATRLHLYFPAETAMAPIPALRGEHAMRPAPSPDDTNGALREKGAVIKR